MFSFAKVFEQIFDSSISEEFLVRFVFEDLLVLADADGRVDKTPEAIARRTNVPIDIVRDGIEKLSQPDPRSRSPKFEGRRLVPIDDHRDWGWVIVNYPEYRKMRDEESRREYMRGYMRTRRNPDNQDVNSCKPDVSIGKQSVNSVNTCKPKLAKEEEEGEGEKVSVAKATSPRRDADGASVAPEEHIYAAYPRKEGYRAAIKAIKSAVSRLRKGEGELQPMELREAKEHLYRRVRAYARSPAGQREDKARIPHPATWMNQSRYLDDDAMWQAIGDNSSPMVVSAKKSALDGMTFFTPNQNASEAQQ